MSQILFTVVKKLRGIPLKVFILKIVLMHNFVKIVLTWLNVILIYLILIKLMFLIFKAMKMKVVSLARNLTQLDLIYRKHFNDIKINIVIYII